jgi:hypothetical protein
MPNNLCPAKRGRFQTRLSRLVDITSSKEIQEPVPGNPGKTVSKTIWLGTLYASNGKVPEGQYEWEASGAYRNQRGVASPLDLSTYVGNYPGQVNADPFHNVDVLQLGGAQEQGKPLATELEHPGFATRAAYEEAQRMTDYHIAAITNALAPKFEVDDRLKPHITGLVLDCYDYLLKAAAEIGLDVKGRGACIRGPWIEAVNETLVGVMDSPVSSELQHKD